MARRSFDLMISAISLFFFLTFAPLIVRSELCALHDFIFFFNAECLLSRLLPSLMVLFA